jgi:hypothetical protein
MANNDPRRRKASHEKHSHLGPILAVIAVIAGLLVFVPETTAALERAVSSMLALPRF